MPDYLHHSKGTTLQAEHLLIMDTLAYELLLEMQPLAISSTLGTDQVRTAA